MCGAIPIVADAGGFSTDYRADPRVRIVTAPGDAVAVLNACRGAVTHWEPSPPDFAASMDFGRWLSWVEATLVNGVRHAEVVSG